MAANILGTKKLLAFVFGCLGTRTALVFLAKHLRKPYLNWLGAVSFVVGGIFFYKFATCAKSFDYDRPWFNTMRFVHGVNLTLFALATFLYPQEAYLILAFDVLLGAVSFLWNYFVRV